MSLPCAAANKPVVLPKMGKVCMCYVFDLTVSWGHASGTLKPLPYTRPCSAFCGPIIEYTHQKSLPYLGLAKGQLLLLISFPINDTLP